jgi:hypothetical protein
MAFSRAAWIFSACCMAFTQVNFVFPRMHPLQLLRCDGIGRSVSKHRDHPRGGTAMVRRPTNSCREYFRGLLKLSGFFWPPWSSSARNQPRGV